MKKLNNYVSEKLHLGKESTIIKYKPQSLAELKSIIRKEMLANGFDVDLNCIDTSLITDMHDLFSAYPEFSGDVSNWNVENVTNMSNMFNGCTKFNCDISGWDVSNVTNMTDMFVMCKIFNQNLNDWNVASLRKCTDMFLYVSPRFKKPEWYSKFN